MDFRLLLFEPILYIVDPYWFWELLCLNVPPISIIPRGFQNKQAPLSSPLFHNDTSSEKVWEGGGNEWVDEEFLSTRVWKKCWSKKLWAQKKFVPKKFGPKITLGPKKMLASKEFWSEKKFCLKKMFWISKSLISI